METVTPILRGLLGIAILLGLTIALSTNRRAIPWRMVAWGMTLQLILAVLMLRIPFAQALVGGLSEGFLAMLSASREGARILFGQFATETPPRIGAFQFLPVIIFFSALSSVLYYLGILQRVIWGMAWVMSKTLRLSGAETLAASANVFFGMTEAPLVVRPVVAKMTESEIFSLMTTGLATIAGSVLISYISILGGGDPEQQAFFARHLLTASILSAPAALVVAKILVPETQEVDRDLKVSIDRKDAGYILLDAAARGTAKGLKLAANVGAILIAFIALVALVNIMLRDGLGEWTGLNETIAGPERAEGEGLTLQYLFGLIFAPVAWVLGVSRESLLDVGQLLGQKTVLNEFFAYLSMGEMVRGGELSTVRDQVIATYALCGFANFGSVGIMVGGIATIAENQRETLARHGMRALYAGSVGAFMTACWAGMLV